MDHPSPSRPQLSTPTRYLLAALIMLAVLAVAQALPATKGGYAYLSFYPGIALAIVICGIGPGMLAVALSAPLYAYLFFFNPSGMAGDRSFQLPETLGFALSALTILGTIHVFRRRLQQELSERLKTERGFEESNARLAGIFDSAMDAIITVDAAQRIVLINPAAERMFGYPAGQMIGRRLETLIPEHFRVPLAVHLKTLAKTADSGVLTPPLDKFYGQRRNGGEFPMEAAISRCVVAGQPIFTVILRDISERLQAEQALINSRRQLATMIEQAPLSIAMFDRQMNYLAVSRRWLAVYGAGYADLTGRNHYAIHPNIPESWKRTHQEAMRGNPASNDHELWIKGDGSKHWLRWAVHPWIDEAGAIGGIIISAEDITQQTLTEIALRSSEDDLVRAQAVGNIGSWRADPCHDNLIWSAEHYRIFGLPPGRPVSYAIFLARVHPDDRTLVDRIWQATFAGKPHAFEHRLLVEGQIKWVYSKAELEFDADGKLIGCFGITQDITGRRLIEDQLKATHDRLAVLAAERAAHLRELSGDLIKAEQRERDRLYELLHDHIQPLLVGVRLALRGLNEATPPAETLRIVTEANEQITLIIQTARTLSIELNPPLIRERGLIPALESLCRWMKTNYGLSVDMDYTPDTEPTCQTTRLLCFKAVRELLMNVVKYAETQVARLDLEAEPGNLLRITVRDQGAGFDPAENRNGSGLANIERRLGMLGGRLTINSSPNAGTVATILVPDEPDLEDRPINISMGEPRNNRYDQNSDR